MKMILYFKHMHFVLDIQSLALGWNILALQIK